MWSSSDAAAASRPTNSAAASNSFRREENNSGGLCHDIYRSVSSTHSAPPTRMIPSSPERKPVVLPTLLPSSAARSTLVKRYEGGAHNRQRVRCNAERLTATQHKTHPRVPHGAAGSLPPSAMHSVKASTFPSVKCRPSHKTAPAASAAGAATSTAMLLRHTFQGTTRVLYADGHVETFRPADAVGTPATGASAALTTGGAGLPAVPHASPTSTREEVTTLLRTWQDAACENRRFDRDAFPRDTTSLPVILATSPSEFAAAPPVVLPSHEAAAQVLRASSHHLVSQSGTDGRSAEASKAGASAMMPSGNTSASLPFQETSSPSRLQAEAMVATTAAQSDSGPAVDWLSYRSGAASTACDSSSPHTTHPAVLLHSSSVRSREDGLYAADLLSHPLEPAQLARSSPSTVADDTGTAKREVSGNDNNADDVEQAFFLTSVPAGVLPLSMEDTATLDATLPGASSNTFEVVDMLRRLQRDIRAEFAMDQRVRAESFVRRFERSTHDSPSLFSLLFPFRPLEEIFREKAQLSAAAGGGGGVPDILLPAAQVTTLMGWTVPELLEERLLPRETVALQHRLRELLNLRGIFDAPNTVACRFTVGFVWFALLRCRKAHREQTLVDGYCRLSKAFADAFPLSSSDTVPLLDVLGELLVELVTCCRYEEQQQAEAREAQLADQPPTSTPPLSIMSMSPQQATSPETKLDTRSSSHSSPAQRDSPRYVDVTELLPHKSFFPLLTGEWAYLLRHAHAPAAGTTTAAAAATTPFKSPSHIQHSPMNLRSYEQAQKTLTILPSPKALQTLLGVYQELWMLHSKYVELCFYEAELYKQLAVLFRNLCVQVAHAAAGSFAGDVTGTTTTLTPESGRVPSALGSSDNGRGDVLPLSSHIAVNLAQFTSVGSLTAASPAAKDSILDSLLTVVAHVTYFTCVFCFPNDMYAELFDEDFRTDVAQWLSYCCHGVMTTHVQTRHWPMPQQEDYDAAQKMRAAAERRELAALGLQRHRGSQSGCDDSENDDSSSVPFLSSDDLSAAVCRRARGGGTARAAMAGEEKSTALPLSDASTTAALPAPRYSPGNKTSKSNNNSDSGGNAVLGALKEESLELEDVAANAEYRLAHQFDRYSRAAAQHVSELERRMARLQRRHRLNIHHGNNANGCGGPLRRQRSGLSASRRSSFATLSRANPGVVLSLDDSDAMGLSIHSITSLPSRHTSFRNPAQQTSAAAAAMSTTSFAAAAAAKGTMRAATKRTTERNSKKASRDIAPVFVLRDSMSTLLPTIGSDLNVSSPRSPNVSSAQSLATAPAAPKQQQRSSMKQRGEANSGNTNNNATSSVNAHHNGVSWSSAGAVEQRSPASPNAARELPFGVGLRRHSSSSFHSKMMTVQRNSCTPKSTATSQPRGDARDVYRTSAFVENDKSLVALAAELNHNALYRNNSGATPSPEALGTTRTAKKHHRATQLERRGVASTGGNGRDGGANAFLTASPTSTAAAAASLLSSYPLCTCPTPITEYWLAMSLRVSSWYFPTPTRRLRSTGFSLYTSAAAAALQSDAADDSDAVADVNTMVNGHRTGATAAGAAEAAADNSSNGALPRWQLQKQKQQHPTLCRLAHEPWRGLFGRVVAVPPISGAAQRAAKLIEIFAESLPYQQSLVYQALRTQHIRHTQHTVDAEYSMALHDRLNNESSLQKPLWSGLVDTLRASVTQPINAHILAANNPSNHVVASTMMSSPARAVSVIAPGEVEVAHQAPLPDLGTATVPYIPPLVPGLDKLSVASQSTSAQSVASYLRRRGAGATYQGCTSPFFQLHALTCLALTLSSEEVSQLRESLSIAREMRREEALLSVSFLPDVRKNTTTLAAATASVNPPLLSQSLRTAAPAQEMHEQQVLSSLLPDLQVATSAAAAVAMPSMGSPVGVESSMMTRNTQVGYSLRSLPSLAASGRREPSGAVGGGHAGTTATTPNAIIRKSLRAAAAPAATSSVFAITAIPREEAKLRPCRMRPLQEEALRRRQHLLADMDTIGKRDGVARQNYVVQQLRLASVMAYLNTDTMQRRYRARGRLALERLAVEEGDSTTAHDSGEKLDD